ncbi:ArsR family transcriptional regulator [Methanospirillum purgamenti]|jgi:ArsR family transcriptional regulator|uniref:ArsR family transcriptional regulator n=1 Tax=Methanospirillum hungatei TaxID=2203 RepID=A0A8F5ZHL3_METHU|nr:ArsR family transcriptional regulator [Methanospirillum hungatei]QXO96119.1 ArsR family transcriptional regulator [Methanospirillum hungatei]
MLEQADLSRLLDILGNRNRRRIIELLREKPCFVTEISERLMISPKAVIDHLQMLEDARILAFRSDERRRKYYYLEHDISIQVHLDVQSHDLVPVILSGEQRLLISLQKLRQMIKERDEIAQKLEEMEREIDHQISEVLHEGKRAGSGEESMLVSVALAHGAKSTEEIRDLTSLPPEMVDRTLQNLMDEGIVCKKGTGLEIRGIYAE